MNDLDKLYLAQQFLQSKLVPLWTLFRAHMEDLVESYNRIDDGKPHHATLTETTDMGLMVECRIAPEPFVQLLISIKAHIESGKMELWSVTDRWQELPGAKIPKKEGRTYRFLLEGDPATQTYWLTEIGADSERYDTKALATLIIRRAFGV